MTLRIFPVALDGKPHFWDDFGQPRGTTDSPRTHQGNDLFAALGTPVLAPDDGLVRFAVDPIGGRSFYLTAADGTRYYGTHLSGYEGAARSVSAGDVIGYVGIDGNARGTSPHLHFEVHPGGGGAVDPFPLLQAAEKRFAPAQSFTHGDAVLLGGVVVGTAGVLAYLLRRRQRLVARVA